MVLRLGADRGRPGIEKYRFFIKILKKSNGFDARGGSGTSGHPDTDGESTWPAADTDSEFRSRGRSGTSGHPDTDGERTWPAADTDGEDRFFGQNRDRAFIGSG